MTFYLIGLALAIILVIIGLRYLNHKNKLKKIDELKSNWGKPINRPRSFGLIARYHNHVTEENGKSLAYEITEDIDLEGVFAYADRTHSKLGQQFLYHQLRSTKKDIPLLDELDSLSEKLGVDEAQRIATEFELSKLGDHNAYYIQELFTAVYPDLYTKWVAMYIKVAGVVWISSCAIAIAAINQYFFLFTLGLTIFNFYIYYTNKNKVLGFIHSLPQLPILMDVGKNLLHHFEDQRAIKKSLSALEPLRKTLRYVNFHTDPTDLSLGLADLIKALLLTEPAMFLLSIRQIRGQKQNLEILFNHIAKVDTAIAILSLRVSLPYYSKPKFTYSQNELIVQDLFHPLVENCVPNSIHTMASQGTLITGSNMSGKTTFIRAVALNTLFAQSLCTSFTRTYEAPFMQLFTSIQISDNLAENQSYFQTEALSILNIVDESKHTPNNLIIIDEIFRGTNTIERIAAAKAILSHLTEQKNFVFVSTHDLELAELLGEDYACYSFEEKAADTRLIFDYKMKPGILKNKNGIAILAALGYPKNVVDDANTISLALREKYNL